MGSKNNAAMGHMSPSILSPKKKLRRSIKLQAESTQDLMKNMKALQLNFESEMNMYKKQKRQSLVISKFNINADKLEKQLFFKAKHLQTGTNKASNLLPTIRQRHSSFDGYMDNMIKSKQHDADMGNKISILHNIQQLQASKVRRYSQIGL